jgi:DNA-directed RNA polymerase subunit RPC12/RpoP
MIGTQAMSNRERGPSRVKITFECESCGSEFTVDAQLGGRIGRCKKCGHRLVIPVVTAPPRTAEPVLHGVRRSAAGDGKSRPNAPDAATAGSAASLVDFKPVSAERLTPVRRESPPKAAVGSAGSAKGQSTARAMHWSEAVNSQVGLKPISLEGLSPLSRTEDDDDDEDSSPYRLAKVPVEKIKRGKRGPGFIEGSYRGIFRRSGKFLRWINETAYGISILFLMIACVGYAMQVYENAGASQPAPPPPQQPAQVRGLAQIEAELARADLPAQAQTTPEYQTEEPETPPAPRVSKPAPIKQNKWTIIGISGIVILNLARFVVGAANLVVIPFRKNPVQGILFLIPPITFYYLWRHWNKVRKPVSRIVGPVIALTLVVAAYAFVPGLSQAGRTSGGLQQRLEASVDTLKHDVSRQVDQTKGSARALKGNVERRLPGEIEKAKSAAQKIGEKVQENVKDLKAQLPGKVQQVKEAGQALGTQAEKTAEQLKSSSPDASGKAPTSKDHEGPQK